MVEKKYQIFISSTFADLKDERQAAMNSVIDLRHIPIGMEGFPAIDEEQMSYIRRLIDECDYYVLIVANRYGSIGKDGMSFTEQEYDYAVSKGKHILAFINDSGERAACDHPDELAKLKAKVSDGRLIKVWADKASLELAVYKSLGAAFVADPREGWVRGASAADPKVYEELAAARATIAELQERARVVTSVPNLADLDTNIDLKYNYTTWSSNRGTQMHPTTKTMSLRELFLAIANGYRNWSQDSRLSIQLDEYFQYKGSTIRGFSVNENERVMILNQFELLGLMKSDQLQSTGGGYFTYYCLTPAGFDLLKTGIAITKSITS